MSFEPQDEETYHAIRQEFQDFGSDIMDRGIPLHAVLTCMLSALINGFSAMGCEADDIPDQIASAARVLIKGPPS